jgi:DNA-directed RNA polymerase subunit RPC12/RpoP
MIRFSCPGCGAVYAVEGAKAGRTGQCPKCRGQFLIPRPEAADPPPPPDDPDAPVEVSPCTGCGVRLSVAPADLGAEVECPYCKTTFRATAASPGPPGSVRDEYDDDRPARRRRRRTRRSVEYDDGYGRRSRKPGEVAAIGGMLLGGGIVALVMAGIVGLSACCLWPVSWLSLVWGILAIIRGSQMLGRDDLQGPPRVLLILQIVLILNGDVINCVLGIVGLVLLNNPAVRGYYERYDD